MLPVKNLLIRRYSEVLLLNLSVEFVIKARIIKIETKHDRHVYCIPDHSSVKGFNMGSD